jgi:hypothetical protein
MGWNSGGKTCNRNGHVFPVRRTDINIESVHFGPPSVLFCFGRNGKVTSQSRFEGVGQGQPVDEFQRSVGVVWGYLIYLTGSLDNLRNRRAGPLHDGLTEEYL